MKPIERFLRETDRVPLMPMPTPLHPMHYQPSGKDVSLLIKRDDMTGVGPGGNKIRSLEFLLGEARSKGASKILAAGPEQSKEIGGRRHSRQPPRRSRKDDPLAGRHRRPSA